MNATYIRNMIEDNLDELGATTLYLDILLTTGTTLEIITSRNDLDTLDNDTLTGAKSTGTYRWYAIGTDQIVALSTTERATNATTF